MFEILKNSGIVGLMLLVMTFVAMTLIVRTFRRMSRTVGDAEPAIERGLHGILFWGVLAALVGFMGHSLGVYKALTVIQATTQKISPADLAEGLRMSFIPSFWGFGILAISGLAWVVLRSWHKSRGNGQVRS